MVPVRNIKERGTGLHTARLVIGAVRVELADYTGFADMSQH
jgi:hypothetical protein